MIWYISPGVTYSQAQTVSGDIIIEQAQSTFDAVGNTLSVASYQRLNDASATTAGTLTSSNARITFTASWLDGIDRQIASANYGAASSFSYPSTPPSSSSTVLVTGTAYDLAGRVYQTTNPKPIVDQTGYDNASRTIQTIEDVAGLARTTNFTWTLDNNKATMTAVNSVTGDQTTAWLYGTTLATSGVARADLLSQTVYPDALGWSTLAVGQWPNLGVDDWANLPLDPTGDVTRLTCNRLGETLTFTDQRGVVRTFNRDKLGRLTNDCVTTCPTGVDSTVLQIAWAYEIRGMVSGVTSFPTASITSPGTPVNDCQLSYNDFAQLVQEYQSHAGAVVPGTTPSVQYGYDNGSANEIRFNTLIYPNLRNITNSFGATGGMNDLLNRVDTIQDTTIGTTDLASYTYLGLGTVVRITYPEPSVWLDLWGGASGVFAGLDLFNRIIDQRWQNNVTTTPADIDRYKYGYDFNSNPQWKQNAVGTPVVSGGLDEYYTMDNLDRLTDMQRGVLNSTFTGIAGTPSVEQQWTLDPTGNWSQFATLAGGNATMTQGRVANSVNEITSITSAAPPPPPSGTPTPTPWATPAYDAAGNMTTMPQPGTPTSAFDAIDDAWNRTTEVDADGIAVGQYQYDGRNRRVVSAMTQTRHFYFTNDWQDIEQRVGTATTMDQQHVWGTRYVDDLVCRDAATLPRLYACQDRIFSATLLTGSSGSPCERFVYDPYGIAAVLDGSWTSTLDAYGWSRMFTAQQHDAETGNYLYRARHYHPLLGAFASRDPGGYGAGSNLFEYCGSGPSTNVDPFGLKGEPLPASWPNWYHNKIDVVNCDQDDVEQYQRDRNLACDQMADAYVAAKAIQDQGSQAFINKILSRRATSVLSGLERQMLNRITGPGATDGKNRLAKLIDILDTAIRYGCDDLTIKCECDCDDEFGYVYPFQEWIGLTPTLHICPGKKGFDEGTTILHELTHYGGSSDNTAGTGGKLDDPINAHSLEDIIPVLDSIAGYR